jgi:hypothetical protein
LPTHAFGGLAHSKTLRAVRWSSANAPAFWSAVARHRFFIAHETHPQFQTPFVPFGHPKLPLPDATGYGIACHRFATSTQNWTRQVVFETHWGKGRSFLFKGFVVTFKEFGKTFKGFIETFKGFIVNFKGHGGTGGGLGSLFKGFIETGQGFVTTFKGCRSTFKGKARGQRGNAR